MATATTQITIFNLLFSTNITTFNEDDFTELYGMIVDEFIDDEGQLKRIPYEVIANYVFGTIEIYDEDNERLSNNLEKLIFLSVKTGEFNSISRFTDKVESHYKLCKEQKEYIQNNIASLNSEIDSAKKTITETVTETEKVNDDIISTKNKMYTEFVAILGIFSALMFGMISGFDFISDTLALLAGETISVGRIAIGTSALAISLITLMYTLVQWVGHLIKNPFRPESFNKESPLNKGIVGFEYRHSLYLLAVYLLLNIMIFGIILIVFSNTGFNDAIYNGTFSLNMIFKEKLSASIAIVFNLVILLIIDFYLIGYRLFTDKLKIKKVKEDKKKKHLLFWNNVKEAKLSFFKIMQRKNIEITGEIIKDNENPEQ